jgi:D-alanyl-D-alanine carboxypeptidase
MCAAAVLKDTPAGRWIGTHATQHGFIIRYPKGSQAVTGYTYEPWHLRYVGSETPTAFKESGARTLEDYLRMPPTPHY